MARSSSSSATVRSWLLQTRTRVSGGTGSRDIKATNVLWCFLNDNDSFKKMKWRQRLVGDWWREGAARENQNTLDWGVGDTEHSYEHKSKTLACKRQAVFFRQTRGTKTQHTTALITNHWSDVVTCVSNPLSHQTKSHEKHTLWFTCGVYLRSVMTKSLQIKLTQMYFHLHLPFSR